MNDPFSINQHKYRDWGGANLGVDSNAYHNVYAVASQMATTKSTANPQFVIGTGDNFYWCGLQNSSDPQIQTDWVQPFSSLNLPWFNILGNHDYSYSVQAQLDYAKQNSQWVLPSRYYNQRVPLGSSGKYMTILYLDTSPCISQYRSSSNKGWDPCGPKYPTCSISAGDDDFEGSCNFHANVLTQDCGKQFNWLQSKLNAVPASDWLLLVGHHPAHEIDVLDFTSAFQKRGFSLYLNGHVHTLSQYTVDNRGAYITTGAGSLAKTIDQTFKLTAMKAQGLDIDEMDIEDEVPIEDKEVREDWVRYSKRYTAGKKHTYQTIWNQANAGFTLHTFNSDFTTLRTDFISTANTILHSFTVSRNGTVL